MTVRTNSAESWESRIGVPESFMDHGRDPADLPGGAGWGQMIDALRSTLDSLAASAPDQATLAAVTRDIADLGDRLAVSRVAERDQAFGHRVDIDGRGQVMAPCFEATEATPGGVKGSVTFGRYFLGGNGAVHGGAVALLFDEVMGRLSDTSGRPPARTAYLKVDFRHRTPVETELTARAWFEREEGRKRYVRGEIRDGNVLCAQAEGLFIGLLDGQD